MVTGVTIGVVERQKVGLGRVFPAILELLGLTTAALMEAGVADLAVVGEHLSARRCNGLRHLRTAGHRDALVTLAVVIGADIIDGMVLAVVPADDLVVLLDEREETVVAVLVAANSQEREMTAWALRNSGDAVADISLEMTLVRYRSTGSSLMATILSASTTMFSVPSNSSVRFRSQWKCTPMVTSSIQKEASSVWGRKVRCRYCVPRQRMPPSENSTVWLPLITLPLAM